MSERLGLITCERLDRDNFGRLTMVRKGRMTIVIVATCDVNHRLDIVSCALQIA